MMKQLPANGTTRDTIMTCRNDAARGAANRET